jgi:hypothetical protein
MTPGELVEMMLKASAELDEAQRELVQQTGHAAQKEHEYRKARAHAYLATSGTVAEREAHVDKSTGDERYAAQLAEGLSKSSLEAVRNKRTQLSVLQTVANAVKEEAALARTRPDY